MGAALGSGDVVDVGVDALRIAVRVLDGDRHLELVLFRLDIEGLVVKDGAPLVEILHIVRDAALIAEDVAAEVPSSERQTIVLHHDGDAAVEISHLAHALRHFVIFELFLAEHSLVRLEGDRGALRLGLAHKRERGLDDAALYLAPHLRRPELRTIEIAVPLHLDGEPLRKRVGDGCAHAVQTARISILPVVELRPRMKLGEHHLHAADLELGMLVHRDSAPVVADARDVAVQKLDGHRIAETVGDLVHAVVDDLPQDVMHPLRPRGADVHTGTLPHRVQPFENADVASLVCLFLRHKTPALRRSAPDRASRAWA